MDNRNERQLKRKLYEAAIALYFARVAVAKAQAEFDRLWEIVTGGGR